ncbi:MAG: DUF3604 domain-containing protein, partial [Alphaproteobacteria bacterium]
MIKRFGIAFNGMFGRRIKCGVGSWDETQHRTQINDSALPLASHRRQHRVGHAENAEHVHVEQRLSLGGGGLLRATEQANAGIVDKQVDAPGLGQHVIDQFRHGRAIGHVAGQHGNAVGSFSGRATAGPEHTKAGVLQCFGRCQINSAFWEHLNALTGEFDEPGRFVAFPGYEWSGNTAVGGDHNVFFRNEGRRIRRSSHALLNDSRDIDGDARDLNALYAALSDEDCVLYAHVGGRYADIAYADDPRLETALELHSDWGSFEWLLIDSFRL